MLTFRLFEASSLLWTCVFELRGAVHRHLSPTQITQQTQCSQEYQVRVDIPAI
jgi:hypothetical protein